MAGPGEGQGARPRPPDRRVGRGRAARAARPPPRGRAPPGAGRRPRRRPPLGAGAMASLALLPPNAPSPPQMRPRRPRRHRPPPAAAPRGGLPGPTPARHRHTRAPHSRFHPPKPRATARTDPGPRPGLATARPRPLGGPEVSGPRCHSSRAASHPRRGLRGAAPQAPPPRPRERAAAPRHPRTGLTAAASGPPSVSARR
jgi:hypothetical protein